MKNILILLVLTLSLSACKEEGTTQEPVDATWQPLVCDHVETVTWVVRVNNDEGLREVRNTKVQQIAIVGADPADVDVRTFGPPADPCVALDDCRVTSDTNISPNGHWRLHSAASGLLTGIEGGGTRVLCSTTVTSIVGVYAPGEPYVEFAPSSQTYRRLESPEYRVR